MEYEILATEHDHMWTIRVYSGVKLCGKMRLDTATKDDLVAKFIELGWTEKS